MNSGFSIDCDTKMAVSLSPNEYSTVCISNSHYLVELSDLTVAFHRGGSVTQLDLINQTIKAKKGRKYHNSGILYFHHVRSVSIDKIGCVLMA